MDQKSQALLLTSQANSNEGVEYRLEVVRSEMKELLPLM